MVICVATLYAVSQLPRHIVYLVTMNSPNAFERETMMYVWLFCHLSTWSATGYNPFIYAWMNRAFRRGLLDLLYNIFCFCRIKRIFGRRRHIVREPGPSTLVEFEPMNTDANACERNNSCTNFDPDC
ncbi:Tachykinin receptor [Paragonimus heterotremus]|uniref:Tachykinin receptor n=1 Tax=Paragonimus heterotremus TaxID=100268 RepID=A0A8J4SUC1_9TREM|nr:Tachykinin receptor [Paragonimus heterotremus]